MNLCCLTGFLYLTTNLMCEKVINNQMKGKIKCKSDNLSPLNETA